MRRMSETLRRVIAQNIHFCRERRFPGRGGRKRCAEALGVSQQQWSPWERGARTPDEYWLEKIAAFFGTSVGWMRERHTSQDESDDFAYDLRLEEVGPFFRRLEKALAAPGGGHATVIVKLTITR